MFWRMFFRRLWLKVTGFFRGNNASMRRDLEKLRERYRVHASAMYEWRDELSTHADEVLARLSKVNSEGDVAVDMAKKLNEML